MEKGAAEPVEPTKPPEIDPELTASAASAVEQWRNYQQAYAAYQHQYAAYQQYIQQTQYAQTAEQQQNAYSQYVEQHRQYQCQLQQYEQHMHVRQNNGGGGGAGGPAGGAGGYDPQMNWQQGQMPMVDGSGSLMMQQPPVAPNGYNHAPAERYPRRGNNFKRQREARPRYREHEKKSELHTKTVIYVNPDDESLLPEDLKKLFKDLQCDLCRTRMNSHVSANIHYQSKSHEKKINQWLKEYCIETGTPMPVRMRRQLELVAEATVVGRSVFHCEACDLPLTSIQHANQHYTGRRHYMVVNGKKLPSGNGFYNAEGKWIRSGNLPDKSIPVTTAQAVKRSAEPASGAAGGGETVVKRERLEPPPELPKELAAQTAAVCWPTEPVPGTTTTPGPAATTLQQMPMVAPAPQQQQQPAVTILEPPPILTIKVDSDDDMQPVVSVATGQPLPAVATTAAASIATVAIPVQGPNPVAAPANQLLNQASTMKPPATTLEQEIRKKEGLDCVDETGTFCLICETSVTSRSEMLMHIKGAKHIKKARTMGVMVRTTPFNPSDTILKSATKPPVRQTDWSLFRMPSGKFYCKTCNLIVADEKLFGQHWYGKKHKLKMRQEQTAAANQSKTAGSASTVSTGTGITVFDTTSGTPVVKTENSTPGTVLTPAAGTSGDTAAPTDSVTPVGAIPAIGDGVRPPAMGSYGKRGWKRPHYFGRKPFYGKPRK